MCIRDRSKKIIILNGSPRKHGNTSALTASFAKGAVQAGNQVTEFHLSGMKINGFDRVFAIAECDPNYRNPKKQSVLIMAAEGAGFEESEHWYDHLKKHIGWQSLGKVLCGYVTQPGDIEGKKELNDAYELGKSIK